MSFFSKFLKGLGFEEETESKPEKIKDNKNKESKGIIASYDLKNLDKEEKSEVKNKTENQNIFDETITNSQQKPSSQFEIISVNSQVEVQEVVDRLKNGEKLLVNFSGLENEDKIRSLDFLSGAVFALNLTMQKVDGFVYLIQ